MSNAVQEMALLGEDQILFSSIPHDEGRGDAEGNCGRHDLSESQKRKILCDNTLRFFDAA